MSFLHNKGEPSMVQRTLIRPPMSRVGPLKEAERQALIEADAANGQKYTQLADVPSAFETLQARNPPVGQVQGEAAPVRQYAARKSADVQ